jgi:hypothetical protein
LCVAILISIAQTGRKITFRITQQDATDAQINCWNRFLITDKRVMSRCCTRRKTRNELNYTLLSLQFHSAARSRQNKTRAATTGLIKQWWSILEHATLLHNQNHKCELLLDSFWLLEALYVDMDDFLVQNESIWIHFGAQMTETMFRFKIQNLNLDSISIIWA